jgi:hypothetical protein
MRPFRALLLVAVVTAGLLSGCAPQLQADGTVKQVVVGCEATSPAKSLACASATLKALAIAADKRFNENGMTLDQFERVNLRLKAVSDLLHKAADAIALANGAEGDYLQLSDDILAALEKDLAS